jgi:Mg2+-importing ATPase
MREDQQKFIASCACPENDALALQRSGTGGLSEQEAAARLETFGRNVPATARKVSLLADLAERTKNPLVIQLLIICIVSALMGDIPSATIVAVMVVLSFHQGRRRTQKHGPDHGCCHTRQ